MSTAPSEIASREPEQPDAPSLPQVVATDPAATEATAPDVPAGASRRELFRRGALAAAALALPGAALPGVAGAQQRRPSTARGTAPGKARLRHAVSRAYATDTSNPNLVDLGETWRDPLLRLVRRVTMGLSAEEVALARRLGFQGYLDYHLDPYGIPDDAAGQFVATNYPALSQSGDALFALAANTVTANLQEATLYQSAFSKRQLYERMVEFWSDHFNISITKVGYLKLLDDREVIRKHALGRFPAMLRASSRSAAMLVYLDQQLSRGTNPNQNYAREIMELHTLGVDGGYTQQDVAELSRILTGWSIEGRGRFAFNASVHDFGRKTFLGVDFPATPTSTGGNAIAEGQRAIGMLLAHPSTATFISTKLLRWLLSYEPTPAQVQAVAAVYTRTGGDVPSLVRAILTPDNLMAAPPKYKRPYHFVVSALRASGAAANTMAGVATMNRTVNALGQQLFVWDFPDGYPDQVEYWAGNIMPRWNAAITIANAASADLMVSVTPFQGATAAAVADNIDRLVFGGEMPAVLRTQLVTFLTPAPTSTTRVREALSLALSSSAFQWY